MKSQLIIGVVGLFLMLLGSNDSLGQPVLYVAESESSTILRYESDLSGPTLIMRRLLHEPEDMALDLINRKIYWIQQDETRNGLIQRSNLDGTVVEDVITDLINPLGLVLDVPANRMYWVDRARIFSSNMDGTDVVEVWADGNLPTSLVVDTTNSKLYWVDRFRIERINLDGTEHDVIEYANTSVKGVALDLNTGKMYWADSRHKISRANLDGTEPEEVLGLEDGIYSPEEIALDIEAQKIYWSNIGNNIPRIWRANFDGSEIEDLISDDYISEPGLFMPVTGLSIDVESGHIYWSGGNSGAFAKIQRADLNGENIKTLVTSGIRGSADGMVIDEEAGHLFWTNSGGAILRSNLDGSDVFEVANLFSDGEPTSLALDREAGKVYWADKDSDLIQRANIDGTERENLVTMDLFQTEAIALDLNAGKMYWSEVVLDKIQRANLDGSESEDIIVDINATSLAIDSTNRKIYWIEFEAIKRANLDGSEVQTLVTETYQGQNGLVLDVPAGKMYWAEASTGRIKRANLDGQEIEDYLVMGSGRPVGLAIIPQEMSSTFLEGKESIPLSSVLISPPYPNPFHTSTRITIVVGSTQEVSIKVYDVTGRKVATLFRGVLVADIPKTATWTANHLPSGMYVIKVVGEDLAIVRNVILLR